MLSEREIDPQGQAPTKAEEPTGSAAVAGVDKHAPRPWYKPRRGKSLKFCVRTIGLLLITLVLVLIVGYRYLTSPARVRTMATDIIEQLTDTSVHIDSAQFLLDGQLVLSGVRMDLRKMPADTDVGERAQRLFEAREIRVEQNLFDLIKGRLDAATVRLISPTFYLVEDLDRELVNFELLQRREDDVPQTTEEQSHIPAKLPSVYIDQGKIIFATIENNHYDQSGDLQFGGNMNQLVSQPTTYMYNLRELRRDHVNGWVLRGQFDVMTLALSADLERFSIDGPQRNFLPVRLRQWWDRLEPAGSLPTATLSYDPEDGLNVALAVRDIELNLPFDQYQSRMHVRQAKFVATDSDIRIDEMIGQIENIDYDIRGSIDGYDLNAPFRAHAKIGPIQIDQRPDYLPALPEIAQKQFWLFTPSGSFTASVELSRETVGAMIDYRGEVHLADASVRYARFPYPLEQASGTLRFDQERVEIVKITGHGPTGAQVAVTGKIKPPGNDAHVVVNVTGQSVPIDQVLYEALPEDRREIIDVFFDQEILGELVAQGLLTTDAAQARDANATLPIFNLGGVCDVVTRVERPLGPDQKYTSHTTVDIRHSDLLFRYWPYPIRITSGQLVIEPDMVKIVDLHGTGLHGGTFVANGHVGFSETDDGQVIIEPEIQVTTKGLPIDALLIASVPKPEDQWVRDANITGTADAQTRIFADPNGIDGVGFDVQITMHDGQASPYHGRYALDGLAGKITIGHQGISFDDIQAQHGQSKLTMHGHGDWSTQTTRFVMKILGEKLRLEDPIIDLLAPDIDGRDRLVALFNDHRPEGEFDAELDLTVVDVDESEKNIEPNAAENTGKNAKGDVGENADENAGKNVGGVGENVGGGVGGGVDFRFGLKPAWVRFDLNGHRIRLDDVQGQMVARPDRIDLRGLTARFDDSSPLPAAANVPANLGQADGGLPARSGQGRFKVDGAIRRGDVPVTRVVFSAQSELIGPTTRAFLPSGALSILDGIELRSPYEIKNATLVHRPAGYAHDRDEPTLELLADVDFLNASGVLGADIRNAICQLQIDTKQFADQENPQIRLNLEVEELRMADRLVKPLTLVMTTDKQPNWMNIEHLDGLCYGGVIMGDGRVQLSDEGRFEMKISLQEARLSDFMNPLSDAESTDAAREPASGNMVGATNEANETSDTSEAGNNSANKTGDEPGDKPGDKNDRSDTGLISVGLSVSGNPNDPASRQGRGAMQIRDAKLYELPVGLGVLQLLNFRLPASSSFDRAAADFVIDGDRVHLNRVNLEAPTVAIVGSGEMIFSTQEVDLWMFSRNPGRGVFGALGEMFNTFKDELVSIHVTGTLSNPISKTESFRGMRASIDELFGPDDDAPVLHRSAPKRDMPLTSVPIEPRESEDD